MKDSVMATSNGFASFDGLGEEFSNRKPFKPYQGHFGVNGYEQDGKFILSFKSVTDKAYEGMDDATKAKLFSGDQAMQAYKYMLAKREEKVKEFLKNPKNKGKTREEAEELVVINKFSIRTDGKPNFDGETKGMVARVGCDFKRGGKPIPLPYIDFVKGTVTKPAPAKAKAKPKSEFL
jgi:hypothetical protein